MNFPPLFGEKASPKQPLLIVSLGIIPQKVNKMLLIIIGLLVLLSLPSIADAIGWHFQK